MALPTPSSARPAPVTRGRRRWLSPLLLLVVALPVSSRGAEPGPPVIASVEVVAHGLDDPGDVLALLGLQVGRPLDRERLRSGIRALYASREVEWLQVRARSGEPGRVDLVVRLNLRARVDEVRVEGVDGALQRRVRRWLDLEVGTPVSATRVQAAAGRVRARLRERGFSRAAVDAYLHYQRSTNTVLVQVVVAPGPVDVLSRLQLDGLATLDEPIPPTEVLETGTRLTERALERARGRLESALRRRGFWEAEVQAASVQHTDAGAVLVLSTDPGPRYELDVSAPPSSEKVVREAIPDPVREDLHPAQTAVLADRVREALQRRGYILARVSADLEVTEDRRLLHVLAEPGKRRRVGEVRFTGADSLDRKDLLAAVDVRPGPTWGWRGQEITDASLDEDRLALEQAYRRRGFADVAVAPPVLRADGDDAVLVEFPVSEGMRWLITEVRLDGLPVEAMARYELAGDALEVADPWDQGAVETERRRLEALLADVGYPDGRVEVETDTSVPGQVRVSIRVVPGPLVHFGEVVVAGLERTRRGLVDRILVEEGVVAGRPFSRASILAVQRRLYELGLFRGVELVPIPGQEHGVERGIVVRLTEGDQRSYLFGLGWDTEEQLRVTLGWSHLNLFGGAHALSLETRLSSREQRYQLGLREPRVPWLNEPGYLSIYRTEEKLADYSQLRRGLWFEVGDRRARPLRRWFRYEYQIVDPDAPDDVLSELERQEQRIRVASVTPALEWDTRDDLLAPTRGMLASASLEYAFPAFTADADFLKLQTGASVYLPVPHGTLALGLRLGAIEPLGPGTGEPGNLQVPLATRFFAGGRVSHRAFRTDRLGVPGQTLTADGDPLGGNALLLLNVDWVRTIKGILAGVLFVDAGNVWAEPSTVDLGDVRWGVGLGLRAQTPAGPLRLEYGHKLDRRDGESPGRWFLSFGLPF